MSLGGALNLRPNDLDPWAGGGNDEMLGIMSKGDALAAARERELDLVRTAGKSASSVASCHTCDADVACRRFLAQRAAWRTGSAGWWGA